MKGRSLKPLIRPCCREDRPAVEEILRRIPQFQPFEVDVAMEVCDGYLADPQRSGYRAFVAEVASRVVGYICYGPTPLTDGTWDIYWIAVAPDAQGRGVGRDLIALAEGRITEARGRLILVETSSRPDYEDAHRFYRSRGYEMVCRIPDFYAVGDDKLVFQKHLR